MHAVTSVVVAISVLDNVIAAGQHLTGTQADTELPTGYAWLIFPAAIGSVLTLLVLISAYRVFNARLSRGSPTNAVAVLVGGLITSYVVCTALAFAFPRGLVGNREKLEFGLMSALGTARAATRHLLVTDDGPHWVFALGGLISGAALVLAILVFSRSARARQYLSADEELEIRRLLVAHGATDSLGYFATRRDKSVVFSPDRTCRRHLPGRRLGLRRERRPDRRPSRPGPARSGPGSASAASTRGTPRPSGQRGGARAYVERRAARVRARRRGADRVSRYHLDGRDMAPVRQAVNRVTRAGYTVQVRRAGTSSPTSWPSWSGWPSSGAAATPSAASRWRSTGSATRPTGECVLVTVHDADGALRRAARLRAVGRATGCRST